MHNNQVTLAVRYFAATVVFLVPLLVLNVKHGVGAGFLPLVLVGFFVATMSGDRSPLTREEKLLFFAVSILFICATVVTLGVDLNYAGYKRINKFLPLVMVIPVYLLLRKLGLNLVAIWYGLAIGSIVTGCAALVEFGSSASRVSGPTNPILFGDIALVMAFMTLAGYGYFKAQGRWWVIIPIAAVILGMTASFLSGARGGWIAVPALITILLWGHFPKVASWKRWLTIAGVIIVCTALYSLPFTGIAKRIDQSLSQISNYAGSELTDPVRASSVGLRFEMWQGAWQIFTENPIAGVGWGKYRSEMEKQALQGLRHPSAATFTHAHSQYLSTLASGGLIGGLGMLLLFVIPLKLFVEAYKEGSESMRQLSMAGILLLVAYLHFALTEAILERMLSTTFLAFYLTVLMVAIHRQRQELMAEPVQRKQRLSVSIIAVNEADRIEQCLDSVSGWADEIVILDSGSTDDTVSIARRYTDQVYETDWPGYGIQKERALEKTSGDWVLSIDADEVLTPELRRDIDFALNDQPDCIAYRLPWAVTIYGYRLDFGRSGRAPLRLFRREGARFSEDQVHETVILPQGKVGKLHGRLLHYTHRDYGHALYKNAHYAWLGAQKRFDRGRKGGGLVLALIRSLWTFFLIYVLRLGFLDGRVGFLMAMIYSQNSFNKYAGLWTLRQQT